MKCTEPRASCECVACVGEAGEALTELVPAWDRLTHAARVKRTQSPRPLASARPKQEMHLHGGWGKPGRGQPMQSAQHGGCKPLPGVSALLLTQDHNTPAAGRTKGVQDGSAAAQGPLGPGEPEELHYASIDFSKLQRKGGEPPEAPATEYSEIRLK